MVGIYWMTYILGLVLYAFYQNNPHVLDFANSNNIFVDFIMHYMPSGVVA